MSKPLQNPVEVLLKLTGTNLSQLADDMSVWSGRPVYRQALQRWAARKGITKDNLTMLECYKVNFEQNGRQDPAAVSKFKLKMKRKKKLARANSETEEADEG